MTESDDGDVPPGPLKDDVVPADTTEVNTAIGGHPRWNWSPVTGGGGTPSQPPSEPGGRSSFSFDLGGALARLGEQREQSPLNAPEVRPAVHETPLGERSDPFETPGRPRDPMAGGAAPPPVVAVSTGLPVPQLDRPSVGTPPVPTRPDALPTRQPTHPLSQPVDNPLPQRTRATAPQVQQVRTVPSVRPELRDDEPVSRIRPLPVEPVPASTIDGSVFDAPAPAPALPSGYPGRASTTGEHTTAAPALPPFPAGALPTLPAANPVAPPSISPPIESAPSTPDLNAFRSAQLRASKQQQQGKLFGRSLLAVLLVAALIGTALLFGRSYLFPAKWDARLTPTVDAIQNARGSDFDHTVPLVVQDADVYTATVLAATVGTAWIDDGPEWRALGLVSGDVDLGTVGAAVAAVRPAVYDPDADTIYLVADADETVLAVTLRSVLAEVFARQHTEFVDGADPTRAAPRILGVSSLDRIAERAADRWIVERDGVADGAATGDLATATTDGVGEGGVDTLPLPIRYELSAVDRLGADLLEAAGADPGTVDPSGYPASLGEVLDDFPANGASGLLTTGDRPLADPVALGLDDWSLVWANRLPAATVEQLNAAVTADSYRPVDRNGLRCFDVLFQTVSEVETPGVLAALIAWSAAGPVGAQAVASQLAATQVQLEACDPGVGATSPIDAGAVAVVLDRQITRLTG